MFKRVHLFFFATTLFLMLSSCDCLIYDDLSACPGKVSLYFYSQIATQPDKTYPEDVKELNLYIFDKNGILVYVQQLKDIKITPDFHIDVRLPQGEYTVVALAGEYKDPYIIANAQPEKTKLSDLMLTIAMAEKSPTKPLEEIYHAKPMNISIASPGKEGNIITRYDVNLLPFTKRVHIYIHGLDLTEEYDVYIESVGTDFGFDSALKNKQDIVYLSPSAKSVEIGGEQFRNYNFSMPGLLEHIKSSVVVIRNKKTGKILKTFQLYAELLALSPQIDIENTYDYDIKIYLKKSSVQYIAVKLIINGWVYVPKETEI